MSLRILILGGSEPHRPAQIRYALERGHHVTVFSRGRVKHDGVEQLVGDRAAGDLEALKQKGRWDVCIDNPTTLPRWVRDVGQVLKDRVKRYVFVSTISVYADLSRPVDEDSPLAKYEGADVYAETMDSVRASGFELYGPLKAASEREALRWFGDRAAIVGGLIVGPGDETDSLVLAGARGPRRRGAGPGSPQDPTQFIDSRDLAEWTIRLVERGLAGTFNATGPSLAMGTVLDTAHAMR